jgi:hypothetical protein
MEMKQQEPEGYICKKSARLCWGRGMLRHTRGRQELASWPTWEDKELSEERNGGKDLQFATTTPLDPVTPFRRQSRACAIVRMNQFWRWNSFRTLRPKGSSEKGTYPPTHAKKATRGTGLARCRRLGLGGRYQMHQRPRVGQYDRARPSRDSFKGKFSQGFKGTWRATCFRAGITRCGIYAAE